MKIIVATAAVTILTASCANTPPPPPVVVNDFIQAVACVEQYLPAGFPAIIANCSKWTFAEIEAVLQWLIANPNTPPAEVQQAQSRLADLRAKKTSVNDINHTIEFIRHAARAVGSESGPRPLGALRYSQTALSQQ